jgi:hypothetical protein
MKLARLPPVSSRTNRNGDFRDSFGKHPTWKRSLILFLFPLF